MLTLLEFGYLITNCARLPIASADYDQHQFAVWISPESAVHLSQTQLRSSSTYFSTGSALLYRASCNNLALYSRATPPAQVIVPQIHAVGVSAAITIQGIDNAAQSISCWHNPISLHNHVQQLIDLAQRSGADGIDIDYETAYFSAKTPQYNALREGYNLLMQELCQSLHTLNKYCSIAVVATKDGIQHRGHAHLPFIFDYQVLSQLADRVEIMAYDEHTRLGAPGPIAGLPWLEQIAKYAAHVMPANKVWLGLPLYGRDWVGNSGTTVKYPAAQSLFSRSDVHPTYDATQGEITFSYGFNHRVWYPSPSSLRAKLAIVHRYGFHAAFWSLGQEFPGTWENL